MIELRHLAYFRSVAELGSIARAATALHMTQPTLSRQIAQLERNVGYQLLRRTPRGTSLTPAGEGLREHVGAIFTQIDRIPEVLSTFDAAERLIRVGIPPGIPQSWFETLLRELGKSVPQLKLSLHESTSEEQRKLLQAGLLDVGVLHLDPPELSSALVLIQRFGCVVRPESALASLSSVRLADLDGLRVMAHSAQENHGQEVRLRAAAETSGLRIAWVFRSFAEHSELIAHSSGVDAVLLGEASARRHFAAWQWIPLDESDEVNALMRTWAAWKDPDLYGLGECLDAMYRASGELSQELLQAVRPPRGTAPTAGCRGA